MTSTQKVRDRHRERAAAMFCKSIALAPHEEGYRLSRGARKTCWSRPPRGQKGHVGQGASCANAP